MSRNRQHAPQLGTPFAASIQAKFQQGLALHQQGKLIEAEPFYNEVLRHAPDHFDALHLLGVIALLTRRTERGVELIATAIKLNENFAVPHSNLGNGLKDLGRFNDSLASYDKAIALKPDYAEAHFNRTIVLRELNRLDEALTSCERAIALKPDWAEALYNRGVVLWELGRWAEAVKHYEQAVALKPDFVEAKIGLCVAQLPILYLDEAEIVGQRKAYQECLEALCADFEQRRIACDWVKAIGSSQPFYLAYQGFNDRELQSRYGSLACRIMAERYPPAALSPPPRTDEPVRLGIVSGFFQHHTVWKLMIRGWLSQIDRRRFRLFGYHTGVTTDTETKQAAALCDRFVRGPLSIDGWRQAILDDAPHVLIYPEVGMDRVSAQLAAQRLAPVQCNSWGHPDTSGFPTLDYYLGSELMEPADGQDHYTERLVRLPNLSIYYEPIELPPVSLSRMDLGLRSAATIYWCGQSLFKYLPQFDDIFPRIALEIGDCQFAFIQFERGTYITDVFRRRLDEAFAAFGLRSTDHCVFLPRLDGRRFIAAIGQCDIVLDSIGWSGGNSTLESLQHDLPIVTIATPLMRGRHSTAILKMMGLEETITETVDDYVSTAVRLARDIPWRMAVKKSISQNKHRVYRDPACVSALEEFLNSAARRGINEQSFPMETSTR